MKVILSNVRIILLDTILHDGIYIQFKTLLYIRKILLPKTKI